MQRRPIQAHPRAQNVVCLLHHGRGDGDESMAPSETYGQSALAMDDYRLRSLSQRTWKRFLTPAR